MRSYTLIALIALVLVSTTLALVARATDTEARWYDESEIRTHTGTADVDVSASDYTAAFVALTTIAAPTAHAMHDVKITLDLDKATTGLNAVFATNTAQIAVQRRVDGTNWRTDVATIHSFVHGSGGADAGATSAYTFDLGTVDASGVRLAIKVPSESGDCEIPYRVTYRAPARATFTDVAN